MLKHILAGSALFLMSTGLYAMEGNEVVEYLNEVMPNTQWETATELKSFPGYFHLGFEGRDQDTQYYFDADKKVLVIGMMVNLNVGDKSANEQDIAPGVAE